MKVVAHSQKELDIFMTDVAQCADISKNAVIRLLSVGTEGVDCNVAMPIAAAQEKKTNQEAPGNSSTKQQPAN